MDAFSKTDRKVLNVGLLSLKTGKTQNRESYYNFIIFGIERWIFQG